MRTKPEEGPLRLRNMRHPRAVKGTSMYTPLLDIAGFHHGLHVAWKRGGPVPFSDISKGLDDGLHVCMGTAPRLSGEGDRQSLGPPPLDELGGGCAIPRPWGSPFPGFLLEYYNHIHPQPQPQHQPLKTFSNSPIKGVMGVGGGEGGTVDALWGHTTRARGGQDDVSQSGLNYSVTFCACESTSPGAVHFLQVMI